MSTRIGGFLNASNSALQDSEIEAMINHPPATFSLASPMALLLLLVIPVLFFLLVRSKGNHGRFRLIPVILAIICVVLALSRPQVLNREAFTESPVDFMLAIDVSMSMQLEDFSIDRGKVSRLEAVRFVAEKFIKRRESDRIGIVAFAGRPYLVSPLTLSKDWLTGPRGLGRVRTGQIEKGTATGSAIAASARRLDTRESSRKVIVLLTDGNRTTGKLDPVMAAKLAKTLGIKIYTIALRPRVDFDKLALQQIADISVGKYYNANTTPELLTVFSEIDNIETIKGEPKFKETTRDMYMWPAVGSFVFGLISLFTRPIHDL